MSSTIQPTPTATSPADSTSVACFDTFWQGPYIGFSAMLAFLFIFGWIGLHVVGFIVTDYFRSDEQKYRNKLYQCAVCMKKAKVLGDKVGGLTPDIPGYGVREDLMDYVNNLDLIDDEGFIRSPEVNVAAETGNVVDGEQRESLIRRFLKYLDRII